MKFNCELEFNPCDGEEIEELIERNGNRATIDVHNGDVIIMFFNPDNGLDYCLTLEPIEVTFNVGEE